MTSDEETSSELFDKAKELLLAYFTGLADDQIHIAYAALMRRIGIGVGFTTEIGSIDKTSEIIRTHYVLGVLQGSTERKIADAEEAPKSEARSNAVH